MGSLEESQGYLEQVQSLDNSLDIPHRNFGVDMGRVVVEGAVNAAAPAPTPRLRRKSEE